MKIINVIGKAFCLKKDIASLTIVGVGPGDPSFLTMAALKAIKKAQVIAFPISSDDKKSYAAEIVQKYIKFKRKIPIIFPMARKEFDPNYVWNNAAETIVKNIRKKNSVVLLCLGDTSLFASSSNILEIINKNHPDIVISIVPGISSLSAAAALGNFDLAKKGETLVVQECPSTKSQLENLLKKGKDNSVLVLMKVGIRWHWVRDVLKQEDTIKQSLLALNVGMNNQIIENAIQYKGDKVPYFSLLLIRF